MKEGRKVTFTRDFPLNLEAKDNTSNDGIVRPFQNFLRIVREIFCFSHKRTETHIPDTGAMEGSTSKLSPTTAQNGKFKFSMYADLEIKICHKSF